MDIKFLNFNQLRSKAIESPNKVAFMVDVFKVLHDNAPPEDFKNLGGRLAGILKQSGNDYCYVLQQLWKLSADGIVGSHLNYMQGAMRNSRQKALTPTSRERPKVQYKKVEAKGEYK